MRARLALTLFVAALACVQGLSASDEAVLKDNLRAYIKKVQADRSLEQEDVKAQIKASKAIMHDLEALNSNDESALSNLSKMTTKVTSFVQKQFGVTGESLAETMNNLIHPSQQTKKEVKEHHTHKEHESQAEHHSHKTAHKAAHKEAHKTHHSEEPTMATNIRQKAIAFKAQVTGEFNKAVDKVSNLVKEMSDEVEKVSTKLPPAKLVEFRGNIHDLNANVAIMRSSPMETSSIAKWMQSRMQVLEQMEQDIEQAITSPFKASSVEPKHSVHHNHAAKKAKSSAHKAEAASIHDKEEETTPSTSITTDLVAEAKKIVESASEAMSALKLKAGSVKDDLTSNLAHMQTDLEMMQTTSNTEALNDLVQAIKMRNEKIVAIKSQSLDVAVESSKPHISHKAASKAVKKVLAKLHDLEKSDFAQTAKGEQEIAELRKTLDEFEHASDENKADLEEKMLSIVVHMKDALSANKKKATKTETVAKADDSENDVETAVQTNDQSKEEEGSKTASQDVDEAASEGADNDKQASQDVDDKPAADAEEQPAQDAAEQASQDTKEESAKDTDKDTAENADEKPAQDVKESSQDADNQDVQESAPADKESHDAEEQAQDSDKPESVNETNEKPSENDDAPSQDAEEQPSQDADKQSTQDAEEQQAPEAQAAKEDKDDDARDVLNDLSVTAAEDQDQEAAKAKVTEEQTETPKAEAAADDDSKSKADEDDQAETVSKTNDEEKTKTADLERQVEKKSQKHDHQSTEKLSKAIKLHLKAIKVASNKMSAEPKKSEKSHAKTHPLHMNSVAIAHTQALRDQVDSSQLSSDAKHTVKQHIAHIQRDLERIASSKDQAEKARLHEAVEGRIHLVSAYF